MLFRSEASLLLHNLETVKQNLLDLEAWNLYCTAHFGFFKRNF
jgi:hypothetical protein